MRKITRSLDMRVNNNGRSQEIKSANITGGKLGGSLSLRKTLQNTLRGINYLALGLSDSINQQHNRGLDLQSRSGGNFFTAVNAESFTFNRVRSNATNLGNASFSLTIDDSRCYKARYLSINRCKQS